MNYLLDKENVPYVEEDIIKWANKHHMQRRIKFDENETYKISTIFLGIDHNYEEFGDPILFETMIFFEGDWQDETQKRYETYEQAIEGHEQALKSVGFYEM